MTASSSTILAFLGPLGTFSEVAARTAASKIHNRAVEAAFRKGELAPAHEGTRHDASGETGSHEVDCNEASTRQIDAHEGMVHTADAREIAAREGDAYRTVPHAAWCTPDMIGVHGESVIPAGQLGIQPVKGISKVVSMVANGEAQYGVVPIENAIEGAVNVTLDLLGFDTPGVYMRDEIDVPVTMNLMVWPGTTLDDIREVRSHPVAISQCNRWLTANLDGAERYEVASTSLAAEHVHAAGAHSGMAALGHELAAARKGLEILRANVQDSRINSTRFVVLGKSMTKATGNDRTTIMVFFEGDRAGQLFNLLLHFTVRGINLTKIVSRPTRERFGEYAMFIDLEGHIDDNHVGNALRAIHRHVREVRILGSYPKCDNTTTTIIPGETTSDYGQARQWYDELRAKIDE